MSAESRNVHETAKTEDSVLASPTCAVISSEEPFQNDDPNTPCETEEGIEKSLLQEDELDTLKLMVQEYKAHRLDFTSLPRRPKFKGPKVNSGIAINAEIRKRVLERAKADPDGTGGGNLSGLIELLLWVFLGSPDDLIDGSPVSGNDP